jgi:hypothetical protein
LPVEVARRFSVPQTACEMVRRNRSGRRRPVWPAIHAVNLARSSLTLPMKLLLVLKRPHGAPHA